MSEWISVKEELPDDSELVAYLCEDGDSGFSKNLNCYVTKYGNPIDVKYWTRVKLPELPKDMEK